MELDKLKKLWEELGDIPINDEGEIDVPFLDFEKGTPREDIWHWFEEENDKFVIGKIMEGKL